VAGVQLGGRLARRAPTVRVLAGFTLTTVAAAAAILPLAHAAGMWGVLPCLWLFMAGCGGCFACAEGLALHHQGEQSGTASSVHGFLTFGPAGLAAPLAGLAGITDAGPVAVVLLATSSIALAGVILLLRAARTPAHGLA
jgi:DHA1 family bicyclomycin/chloramphenicol resistance-like MFS transporter